jgi:hypothetical protein
MVILLLCIYFTGLYGDKCFALVNFLFHQMIRAVKEMSAAGFLAFRHLIMQRRYDTTRLDNGEEDDHLVANEAPSLQQPLLATRERQPPLQPSTVEDDLEPGLTLRFGGIQMQSPTEALQIYFVSLFRRTTAVLPTAPENAWGGITGLILGTHPLRNTYAGGGHIAQFLYMGWRTPVDVAGFHIVDGTSMTFVERDGVFNWEQYCNNECWICCSSDDHWDLWTSCRHAFCARCSEQMQQHRMPCPLCRTVSTVVVRRAALIATVANETPTADATSPTLVDEAQVVDVDAVAPVTAPHREEDAAHSIDA